MKLLIFAYKPPPFGGQSYMVQLALEKLGGDVLTCARMPVQSPPADPEFQCYHIDVRLSDSFQQTGVPSVGKLFRLLRHCMHALWCRFRYGIPNLYFVPAHAARASLMRDWIALAICRPFFRNLIYHWHAAGQAEWLEKRARPWERWLTSLIMGRPALSLVLRPYHRRDAEALQSRRIEIVPNGIPDPCKQFDADIGPRRRRRAAVRRVLLAEKTPGGAAKLPSGGDPEVFRVLFLNLCCREKGLFDAVEAVAQANQRLNGGPVRIELVVAGTFQRPAEQAEFEERIRRPDLVRGAPLVRWVGFAAGGDKERLFVTSDCLCLPTWFPAEAAPIALIEAMAYGLPVVVTRWRELDEMLPAGYRGMVDLRSPGQIADRLLQLVAEDYEESTRRKYETAYTDEVFAQNLRVALLKLA